MEIAGNPEPKLVPRIASFFDERGVFSRLIESPIDFPTYQLNTSINLQKGIFRGLHLLKGKHSEHKKITVLKGEIVDIVINVDFQSNLYGTIYEYKLSQESDALWIPPLHAHGFITVSDITFVAYQVDKPYVKHADSGVNIKNLKLNIAKVSEITRISDKDLLLPIFSNSKNMGFSKCDFC
jgi:dTDP-4-dehydrorhamnose 3,5-epimerase